MKKILFIIFLFCSLIGYSTVYYILPTGSDATGNGTIGNPWFTLTKGVTTMSPGDTVYMRGGTYQLSTRIEIISKSGTVNNRLYLLNYPGESPVFEPINLTTFYSNATIMMLIRNSSYITLRGLEIRNLNQTLAQAGNANSALLVDGTGAGSWYNVFENLTLHNCGNGMRIVDNSARNQVINCDFYENKDPYTNTPGSGPYGNADGLQVAFLSGTATSDTNWIRGCRFWLNSDDGFDSFDNQGTVIIDSSWLFKNGYSHYDTIINSIYANGNGFKLGPSAYETTKIERLLTRCVAAGNKAKGIESNEGYTKTVLKNCTMYNNGGIGLHFSDNGPGYSLKYDFYNCVMLNNYVDVFVSPYTNIYTSTHLVGQPGLPNTGLVICNTSDFLNTDLTELTTSRQTGGTLPDINFLHLRLSSDLIDKGTDVDLIFSGDNPDLGAFEYTLLVNPPKYLRMNGKSIKSTGIYIKQ